MYYKVNLIQVPRSPPERSSRAAYEAKYVCQKNRTPLRLRIMVQMATTENKSAVFWKTTAVFWKTVEKHSVVSQKKQRKNGFFFCRSHLHHRIGYSIGLAITIAAAVVITSSSPLGTHIRCLKNILSHSSQKWPGNFEEIFSTDSKPGEIFEGEMLIKTLLTTLF